MIPPDLERIILEQRLGFVATVNPDGTPNVSPKGTFVVLDTRTVAFAEIRSPNTRSNLAANPAIEVNFVDPFSRRGCRLKGRARVTTREDEGFEDLLAHFREFPALQPRMRAVVVISVDRALPLTSPVYDDGMTEEELRQSWWARFQTLNKRSDQDGGR
jgi:predicted pyridoxine 5'-phosphate oxidase superfamily flavin-nucleotide-binding protein